MRHLRLLRYVDAVARIGSIRRAAEELAVTPSALNRRIQDLEDELGTKIFERLPRGVRLNAAGELLVRHIRGQMADLDRVRSQIEDLSGMRRGRVAIACSQALAYRFLPDEIARYREKFPLVTFDVEVRDHGDALKRLTAFEVDLVLVFRPAVSAELQPLMVLEQRLSAIMAEDHPLAREAIVRLRDCARHPLALPGRTYGGRQLLEDAVARASYRLEPVVESNSFEFLRSYVRREPAITFQIEIGTPAETPGVGLVARPVDPRDVPPGPLVMGQLRGRALPVASAKFGEQLARSLDGLRLG